MEETIKEEHVFDLCQNANYYEINYKLDIESYTVSPHTMKLYQLKINSFFTYNRKISGT